MLSAYVMDTQVFSITINSDFITILFFAMRDLNLESLTNRKVFNSKLLYTFSNGFLYFWVKCVDI